MIEHSASSRSPSARGTRYSAARMGVEGTRRCQRGGSFQRSASTRGADEATGWIVPIAALGRGDGCHTAEGEGGGPSLSSEGVREQAAVAVAARQREKRTLRIGRR